MCGWSSMVKVAPIEAGDMFRARHRDALMEVRDFVTRCLWTYHLDRPNVALGGSSRKQKLALAPEPSLLALD